MIVCKLTFLNILIKKLGFFDEKVLAPIFPFTSEMIWQEVKSPTDPISVHLANWGEVESVEGEDLENIEKMEQWVLVKCNNHLIQYLIHY